MKKLRLLAVSVLLLACTSSAFAVIIPCEPDMDGNVIYCGAECNSGTNGSYCGTPAGRNESGNYCIQMGLINTNQRTCHPGSGEPCCTTSGAF